MTDREALQALVDECQAIRPHLLRLNREALPAWQYNCWYRAMQNAEDTLKGIDL